jgi:hypothetical protein
MDWLGGFLIRRGLAGMDGIGQFYLYAWLLVGPWSSSARWPDIPSGDGNVLLTI